MVDTPESTARDQHSSVWKELRIDGHDRDVILIERSTGTIETSRLTATTQTGQSHTLARE